MKILTLGSSTWKQWPSGESLLEQKNDENGLEDIVLRSTQAHQFYINVSISDKSLKDQHIGGGTQWTHEEYQQEKYGIATKHDETKLLKVCLVLRNFSILEQPSRFGMRESAEKLISVA